MARLTILVLVIYFAIFCVLNLLKVSEAAAAKPPAAIFIFGDSTKDVGTNNHLKECTAKADHLYNGIDYPFFRPTGRFSNGYNSADQIARLLGDYKVSPPPFLSLLKREWSFQRNLIRGVNFASGGAGIFSDTGVKQFNRVISLEEQIQQMATVRGNLTESLGSSEASNLIQNSVYILGFGSNDILYFRLSFSPIKQKHFIANLTNTYSTHLKHLYELGARKFGIIGVPPLGCCPAARVYNSTGGCLEDLNSDSRLFYNSLQSQLQTLSSELKGFKYSLGNAYAMSMNLIENPLGNGFKEAKTACCGSGRFNGEMICQKGVNLCPNRKDYLFWDLFHPTEAASELAALTLAYAEGTEYVSPMNFSSLARA